MPYIFAAIGPNPCRNNVGLTCWPAFAFAYRAAASLLTRFLVLTSLSA